jgi:uncharacterized membrane protein
VPVARPRLDSVDLLRGLAIVLMSLDHVREFLSAAQINPTDPAQTTPALFFTRWVTHFCAPVFVFLAGAGAYLYRARGHSTGEVSWFLLTRGLWLVVLELTVVRLAWFFNFDYFSHSVGQVIWTIGWSMVALAGLVHLPVAAIATIGVLIIAFHNLFDPVAADSFGRWAWVWRFLHDGGPISPLNGVTIHVAYALLPWLGVMAAGYAFGAMFQLPASQRRSQILALGVTLSIAFVGLRYANVYGDPAPWAAQGALMRTVFSFLNLQKYPPSLLFLLMTLGPAMIFLAAVDDRPAGPLGRMLVTFGRVPLFYYVVHLYVIHALAVGLIYWQHGETPDWLFSFPPGHAGEGYGYSLPVLYAIWFGIVAALYPLCRWFAGVKRRSSAAWLSYL